MENIIKASLIFIAIISLHAQESNPFDYYPYHVGDIWQYVELSSEYPQGKFREVKITRIDTVNNGKEHLVYHNASDTPAQCIIIDSAKVYSADKDILIYDLASPIGTYWERKRDEEWVKYFQNDEQEFWNNQFNEKIFYVYYWQEPDSLSDWAGMGEVLAENLGLQRYEWEGGREELIGCMIDGIKFGDLVGIEDTKDDIPVEYPLISSYPNPFNGVSIIIYSLPNASDITLAIFDVLGRKVATLYEGYTTAGEYREIWSPQENASGIYFVTLTTPNQIITSKLVYQK